MSDSRRSHDKSTVSSSSLSKTVTGNGRRSHSKDENERYNRKRTHGQSNSSRSKDRSLPQRMPNIHAKVYVGNVPTDRLSDTELLEFFKPFGKISDIRVYKGYIFVQYDREEEARKLIEEGQSKLMLKGNKLDVLPAMEATSTSTKTSSTETTYKDQNRDSYQLTSSEQQSTSTTTRSSSNSREQSYHRYSDQERYSSNYEPIRKRSLPSSIVDNNNQERSHYSSTDPLVYGDRNAVETEEERRMYMPSSCSRRQSPTPLMNQSFEIPSRHQQAPFTMLTTSGDPHDFVDCHIIIVNPRQRDYANEIESRLRSHGLLTSIVLLHEDYSLKQAIENATRRQCLYAIIAMNLHEERRTASFHILYGQTEEHRNLTLEDGYHIILSNFTAYKERLRRQDRSTNESALYSQPIETVDYNRSITTTVAPPALSLGDKLPLSMLLCLLADGRQLTLDEIDRVLVYLLEKKAKMLTLPPGTLPPLPVQYATANTVQTGSGILTDSKSISTSDMSSAKALSPAELSSTIAEQIRQIFSTSISKQTSSNAIEDTISHVPVKPPVEPSPDGTKFDDTSVVSAKKNVKDAAKEYVHYQQAQQRQVQAQAHTIVQQQQQKTMPSFSYTKQGSVAVVAPSFHYSSASVPANTGVTSFAAPTFSSYDTVPTTLSLNSPLKVPTVSNFVSQPAQYFYQGPPPPPPPPPPPAQPQNVYQTTTSSAAADAAAAIFQAYSQFNARPTATAPSVVPPTATQQQQIRK